ncbi:MAG: IS30 family transposase [Candidatus Atribacteria bacterium]|nr:IS30 family transposase [Candidatus Atribacteria bacterium]
MIEKMLKQGMGIRAIGRVLNRGHSTISEEISKNKMTYEKKYSAEQAQARHKRRQLNKGNKRKLDRKTELKKHVIKQLEEDWSPEQIAGDLKKKYGMTIISHETIYQFIYSEEGRHLKLWLHLRIKHKPYRRVRGKRKSQKGQIITERVSIHQRPKEADDRVMLGHLESDSMIFSNQKPVLSVQVDRASQKCALTKVNNKTALETKYALVRAIEEEYASVETITYDNGSENVLHIEIRDEYQIATYFCDPYCSWQKGLVEQINGLIRQYLPRHINMNKITQDQIYEIQEKINNRPRKSLNYRTPNQVYSMLVESGRFRA